MDIEVRRHSQLLASCSGKAPDHRAMQITRPLIVALLATCTRTPAAEIDTDPDSLDEIVVTATRRATRLMETPVSITAVTDDTLRAVNAAAFADFAALVPGLTSIDTGPGQKRYALRGLQSAGEPEVALYYDEIPISGLPGASLDTGDSQPDIKLWDVDRVEVIRGPQGTLYGNGSMGGAIRVISRRPVLDSWEGAAEAAQSFTDGGAASWRLNGMLNAPLIDNKLAVRLATYYRREGGWLDNALRSDINLPQISGNNLNSEHTWGGRLSATFQASDDWTLTAIGYYQKLRTGDSFETYPSFATNADRYVSKAFVRTPWLDESRMFNLISTFNLGWADLVATASHQKRAAEINLDSTRFLLSFSGCTEFTWNVSCTGPDNVPADSSARQGVSATSAEIRLVSRTSGALEWTVGAFMQDSSTFRRGQLAMTNARGYIDYDPASGDAIHRLFARSNDDTFDQYAMFGEATYRFMPAWSATIGGRWFHSYRSDQQVLVQQFFPGSPVGAQPFQDFRESALFKKFQLTYQPAAGRLFYLTAAQGFRAGGPNYPGGFALTAPPYEADSAWNYEFGWKLSLAEHRIDWTGAVYRIDWKNVQQLLPVQIFSSIVNGGAARSDGFETELVLRATEALAFSAGTAYANAQLHGAQPIVTNPALQLEDGDRLAGVPKWTVNAAAAWSHSLRDGLMIAGRIDHSRSSSRGNIVSSRSPNYFVIDGGDITGLHLSVERSGDWAAALHVANLFNQFVPLSGKVQDGNQIRTLTAARPRTVSLSFTTWF
jgi:iron complex outermembrane recepter protein